MANFRTPDAKRQLKRGQSYQDTRRIGEQIADTLPKWDYTLLALAVLTLIPFIKPVALGFIIPVMFLLTWYSATNDLNRQLPIKLPVQLGNQEDKNAPKPGQKNKYYNGQGTILLGNLRDDNTELWLTGKDMLTHMLLIGTTGAGKTETLVSLSSCTAFCMGGGTIYVDAKAAPKLTYQFWTLARIFGREDDVNIISFIMDDSGAKERHWARLSNTTNPFSQGSANNAVQTLASLLPPGGGDNQYFLDRAIALLTALMPALVELREKGVINIYPSLIGDFISVSKFMELSRNEIIIGDIEYKEVSLSDNVLMIIRGFLKALPGFDPDKPPAKQGEQVHHQFGFAEGYFARTLSSLSGTYGHIYQTELAEADFIDIVMHNRILIVLVPAMGLAPDERQVLGKIILSCIRAAMGLGLGSKGEGDREDVLDALPVDLKIPTIIIVDEYAEVAVEGFAVTATQGRGLGMSVVFAGQDLDGFVRASESEAGMIFGNTRLKVLMALEDPETTWNKFKALAGTMSVSKSNGFENDPMGMVSYKKNMSASIEEVDRINILDLKEQTEGQAHVFERSEIHRAQLFHHGISDDDLVLNTRLNRKLKVKKPKPAEVAFLQSKVERNFYMQKTLDGEYDAGKPSSEFSSLLESFKGDKKQTNWPWALCLEQQEPVVEQIAEEQAAPVIDDEPKSSKPETSETEHSSASVETTKTKPNEEASSAESTTSKSNVKSNTTPEPNELGMSTDLMDDLLGDNEDSDDSTSGKEDTKEQIDSNESEEKPTEVDASVDQREVEDISKDTADISDTKQPVSEDNYISDTLAKVENHWVFKNSSDPDGISKSMRMFDTISELNSLTGQPEKLSSENAAKTMATIADSIHYPSRKIESKAEDVDDLWAIINNTDSD